MKTKRLLNTNIKSLDATGELEACFATLETLDHDNDVIKLGAIQMTDVKLSSFGHQWESLPIGKGKIFERGTEAIFKGKIFLNTQNGKETYETLRELGNLAEFSFGYDVLESRPGKWQGKSCREILKMRIFEVSPVFLGAGINTRILSLKSAEGRNDFLSSPRDLLDQLARDYGFGGDITRPIMALAQIAALEKAVNPGERMHIGTPKQVLKDLGVIITTNRDRIRARYITEYPGASLAWIETVVEGEIAALAERLFQQQEQAGSMSPNRALAQEEADAWAAFVLPVE